MTERLSKQLWKVHRYSINRCFAVAHIYMRFKVGIPISILLSTGFFQKNEEGVERWIQFKYEKNSYMCYKYGRLDHIIGKCLFEMTLKNNGISSNTYCPWLKAKNEGSLSFINSIEISSDKRRAEEKKAIVESSRLN